MSNGPRIGEQRSMRLRRIGEHHIVLMPQQTAMVVDVRRLRAQLDQAKAQLQQSEARTALLKRTVADLGALLERTAVLDVDRDADDPDVTDG